VHYFLTVVHINDKLNLCSLFSCMIGGHLVSRELGGSSVVSRVLGGSSVVSRVLGGSSVVSRELGGSSVVSRVLGGSSGVSRFLKASTFRMKQHCVKSKYIGLLALPRSLGL
jgi:hypothetical protein